MYPIFGWTIKLNFIVSCEGRERAQTLHLNFMSTMAMETVLWGGQNQNVVKILNFIGYWGVS